MKNTYQEYYIPNDNELDLNENISVFDVLKMLQRVTFSHSNIINLDHKTMIEKSNAFWVVTKMKYVLNSPIKANEKVLLKTWTQTPSSVRFLRDIQIKKSNKVLVKALSEWCCLDFSTNAIRRSSSICYPDLEMIKTNSNNLKFTNTRIEVCEKDFVYTRTIRATDIDVNNHTNNLKYTNIAMDAFSVKELKNKFIKEYEIYFVNQSYEGDEINVYKKKVGNLFYIEGKVQEKTIFKVVLKLKEIKKGE